MYSTLTVNENVTLAPGVRVKGESSGATGYVNAVVSDTTSIVVTNVEGDYFKGERLIFNGVLDNARFITKDVNHKVSDIKSVFGIVGTANTFTGDTVQSLNRRFGSANVSAASGGESLISIPADPGWFLFCWYCIYW